MKRRLFNFVDGVIDALLIIMLLINLYNIIQRNVYHESLPRLFGIGNAIVISGSMEPVLSVNDVVYIKESDSYEVGDIITYKEAETESLITHRITAKTADGYITKGDANNTDDKSAVKPEQIQGKVFLIVPGAGVTASWLKRPIGTLVMILLALLLIELPYQIRNRSKVASEQEIEDAVAKLRTRQRASAPEIHEEEKIAAEQAETPKTKTKTAKKKRRRKPEVFVPEEGKWNID